jgi:hypothetical protein
MLSENNNNNNNNDDKTIERISGRIRSLVEHFNKEEGASVTISVDKESGVIRICNQEDTIIVKRHPLRYQKFLNYLMPHRNIILIGVFFIMPLKSQKQFLTNGIQISVKMQSAKCQGEQIKSRYLEKIYEHNIHENS